MSSRTKAANASGKSPTGVAPSVFNRLCISASASPATIAEFSFCVVAGGNFAGPNTPNHALELETGDDLGDRRHVREGGVPLRAGDAIGAQLPGANLRRPGDNTDEHQIDLAAEHIGERRRGSFIRHVKQSDAGH